MSDPFKLVCTECGAIDVPVVSRAPHAVGGGEYLRAKCAHCGEHIKFLSKDLFKDREIALMPVEDETDERQQDLFGGATL